jgi:hypothetical protein
MVISSHPACPGWPYSYKTKRGKTFHELIPKLLAWLNRIGIALCPAQFVRGAIPAKVLPRFLITSN